MQIVHNAEIALAHTPNRRLLGVEPGGPLVLVLYWEATFPEQVMNSALQYQLAKPIVDAVMKDAGLSNEGITGVASALSSMLHKPEQQG